MKIAVVILNWNGKQLLNDFLPSIVQFSPQATIYVADNASTDDSINFIEYNFPSIVIIKNKFNNGYAGGYNEALKQVQEDIFALVNSDIEVTENWLLPIIESFKNEPQTAIIQPKILDYKDKKSFEYAGAAGGFIDRFGYPFCRGRIFDTIEIDNHQYDNEIEIFWASGACFFIRKSVFNSLNGFDSDLFAHQEEIDLCWRALNRNWTIKYNPKSLVYHIGGATLSNGNPKKTYLNFRNSLFILIKNLPKNQILPIIFSRLVLDGIAGVRFLINGQFMHFIAILKAHFSFYYSFIAFYKKREKHQNKNYYKCNSIVYLYFVKNGTVFEKLF